MSVVDASIMPQWHCEAEIWLPANELRRVRRVGAYREAINTVIVGRLRSKPTQRNFGSVTSRI
jgi:hypothetical protein